MKKLTFLIVITLTTLNFTSAQTIPETDQITVRVYEDYSGSSAGIIISYGNNRTESIGLNNLRPKFWEANVEKINEVLTNITRAGYKISTSNSGGLGDLYISTYIFIKEE
jgi:hypothetical protein